MRPRSITAVNTRWKRLYGFIERVTKSFEGMDVFTKRVTKSFEQMSVLSKWVTKSFERMSVFTKRVSKSFEWLDVSTERVVKPFEGMQIFFEWMTQVVRMYANCLRTASKRLVNGIPFENRKSLVYVFPWNVTNIQPEENIVDSSSSRKDGSGAETVTTD